MAYTETLLNHTTISEHFIRYAQDGEIITGVTEKQEHSLHFLS